MKAIALLARLSRLDVQVWAEGDRLRYSAPKGVLTPPLRAELAATKGDLLRHLKQAQTRPAAASPPLGPSPRGSSRVPPLSFAQERLWFFERFAPGTWVGNVPFTTRIRGPLQVDAVRGALDALVARHEVFRTAFPAIDGLAALAIEAEAAIPFCLDERTGVAGANREAEAIRLASVELRIPFVLDRGPLIRARLIRFDGDDHVLVLVIHHIVFDGWSFNVFVRELAALYDAFRRGLASPLPAARLEYADFAAWQRDWLQGEVLEGLLGYWLPRLEGLPRLELPTDRPRPPRPSYRGASQTIDLPLPLTEALETLGKGEGATPFMTLLAAFQVLLGRYSGQVDFAVGSPIANRNRSEVEDLIGLFVNTLVLRADLGGDPTFRTLLARVREETLGAYDHQDLPFEKLVEQARPERDLGRNPLFQVCFALKNPRRRTIELEGLSLEDLDPDVGTTQFDLEFYAGRVAGGMRCLLISNVDLFEEATARRLLRQFRTLLEGIVADPDRPISRLPLLEDSERSALLEAPNATAADYPRDVTLAELFRAQALRTPGKPALVDDRGALTYEALENRANRLAHRLRALGVGRENPVGILMGRSIEAVAAILAVLKAGGAYVPLDPEYPLPRIAWMLEDCGARVLVTEGRHRGRVPGPFGGEILVLDPPADATGPSDSSSPPAIESSAVDLAYIMYTSGSTGTPKGVAVPQRAVARLVLGVNYVPTDDSQVFLLLSSLSFDASTFEIWCALLNGSTCAVYPGGLADLATLEAVLRRERVTCLWLTAALFNAAIDRHPGALAGVRHLLIGGEALSVPHVRRALEHLPGTRLVNGYGPTECTTFACTYEIPRDLPAELASIPIGRPIANTTAYILDPALEPVPPGIAGELHLGGDGLAIGYHRRPGPTAERFLPDPFGARPGGRLYRTGDRARWRPDGTIEFLGRFDEQVKIRGHRIEPGEVEAALLRHPRIREARVLAHDGESGDRRLVAYLVGDPAPDTSTLKTFLAGHLPPYLIPTDFIPLDVLPLTVNGKVDRRRLPAPGAALAGATARFIAPRSPLESRLAEIWTRVLGRPGIGLEDHFFDLGGHSLLVVRLAAEVEQAFGHALPLNIVFQHPTLERMAAAIDEELLGAGPDPSGGPGRARLTSSLPFFAMGWGPTLASHLGSRPVYGIDVGLGDFGAGTRIEDLAGSVAARIRAIQPGGPYLLGGYSRMGVIAYEAARQLEAEGERIALLALIDPTPIFPSGVASHQANRSFRRFYYWNQTIARIRELTTLPAGRWLPFLARRAYRLGERLASTALAAAHLRPLDPAYHAKRSIRRYAPSPYLGSVLFFVSEVRAAKGEGHPTGGWTGWKGLVRGEFAVHVVPGDHDTLFEAPNVEILARVLNEALRGLD